MLSTPSFRLRKNKYPLKGWDSSGDKQMAILVFDLDMTVIDSSHRHASNADGSIDLAHWFENATAERIAQDSFLPLARAVRTFYDAGNEIILCTARSMQQADWDFLDRHFDTIPHHRVFSRDGYFVGPDSPEFATSFYGFVGDARNDGDIKMEQLTAHIQSLGFSSFREAELIIFEDNLRTLEMFKTAGAIGINAITCNAKMKRVA